MTVLWKNGVVFRAISINHEPERTVRAYAPGEAWEAALDVACEPIKRELEDVAAKSEARVRQDFGL